MNKRVVIFILVVGILLSSVNFARAVDNDQSIENYIAFRIKYIHNNAYNTSAELPKQRSREYAEAIVYWSNEFSQRLGVEIDPLLVTAIIETETNFVSRSDYDDGLSIGVSSMKISTAEWIANKLGEDYNKWRMLDATDLGIKFTAYYMGLAYQRFDDLNQIIVAYNQGFGNAARKSPDKLYNNYLFKVLGRYDYYQERINAYANQSGNHFKERLQEF